MDTILIYHGSTQIVPYPEIRIGKFHKDFYFGFYCTIMEKQAKRWAVRFGREGYVSRYQYTPNEALSVRRFDSLSEEWLDFVVACRMGQPHGYDIVEGPMADDTIYNYVQSFMDGKITRAAFWELARFKYPTHQISFHTVRALLTLEFAGGERVHEE